MKRYDYIDISKGIGILLVVWAHIMITGSTHRVIYAFHMPLFFLLSGMLFKRERFSGFASFIKKRSKRLLLPYAVYSVATWALWAMFRYIRHDEVVSYWEPLLQTIIAKGSGEFMVHNSALWFVPCLFVTEIMYFIISKMKEVYTIVVCILCSIMSFVLGYYFGDNWWFLLPWNFDAALIALIFYCFGNIFIKHFSHKEVVGFVERHYKLMLSILCLLSVILYFGATIYGECSMGSSSYQCSGIVFTIRAIIGCVSLIVLALILSHLQNSSLWFKHIIGYIKWLGINSLDVMCLHIPIKGIFVIIIAVLLQVQVEAVSSTLKYSMVVFIPTVICVSMVIMIIQRVKTKKNIFVHVKR
jgi:acyltransferase